MTWILSSMIIFVVIFIVLCLSAFAGKKIFHYKEDTLNDEHSKIILGAILSLLGLLIGFVLSISINGYNERQKTEENEMMAIGSAIQITHLLPSPQKEEAHKLLKQYLDARISFFQSQTHTENKKWLDISSDIQNRLWNIAVEQAKLAPNAITTSILNEYADIYYAQDKTTVSWRYQIPDMVWGLLIFFAIVSNYIIGYHSRDKRYKTVFIYMFPFLITLALFIISEIDIPGKGVIHVTPDDLQSLKAKLR